MTTPANVIPMSLATSVLLSDGWHDLTASSLSMVIDPSFADLNGNLVTPGEPWVQFEDASVPPVVYACPMRCLLGVKMPALVTPQ